MGQIRPDDAQGNGSSALLIGNFDDKSVQRIGNPDLTAQPAFRAGRQNQLQHFHFMGARRWHIGDIAADQIAMAGQASRAAATIANDAGNAIIPRDVQQRALRRNIDFNGIAMAGHEGQMRHETGA